LVIKFIYLNQQWYIDEYDKKESAPVDVWQLLTDLLLTNLILCYNFRRSFYYYFWIFLCNHSI
jgi:hypothetical protein